MQPPPWPPSIVGWLIALVALVLLVVFWAIGTLAHAPQIALILLLVCLSRLF